MDSITPTRNELLGQIDSAARDLDLETRPNYDRTVYESILNFLIGRDSCKDATMAELALVADALTKRAEGRQVESVTFSKPARTVIIVTDEEFLEVLGIYA